MSDPILHECGIALLRLRKPLAYYLKQYGPTYVLNKMYILMEKQHNRGQDGAGVATIKLNQSPGFRFFSRYRSVKQRPVEDIFKRIGKKFEKARKRGGGELFHDEQWLKENVAFMAEVWLGHLRYGTHGKNSVENVHPFFRSNNWRSRNLTLAGNFNMTNVDELFDKLVSLGQHPKDKVDTVTVMEKIGHFLDAEVQSIFEKYKETHAKAVISGLIEEELDLGQVLRRSCKDFDGGYAMAGMTGFGSSFVVRDPCGIRPAYYYADDEIVVVASEKTAIKAAFQAPYEAIRELQPGCALIINKNGDFEETQILPLQPKTSCSFERIYFSRGTDPEIYQERKKLGRLLVPQVLKAINFDLKNTIFSYIPNTAETAFLGMMAGIDDYLIARQKEIILQGKPALADIEEILNFRPRIEKIIVKDVKVRTFIANDANRSELVSHVYDATYEVAQKNRDTLVIIDDSIVRGTTLEQSILKMLAQLHPKKVIILSSAPQIRYPDCYGIDMSKLADFVAFRAVLKLLKESGQEYLLQEVYEKCKRSHEKNYLKEIYAPFTDDQISDMVARIIIPKDFKATLQLAYQTVPNLHKAIPKHRGDWYFTGDYPTPGGIRVANRAFINFMEGRKGRAY